MAEQVLRRYLLNARHKDLDPIYPGAEVWGARDTTDQSLVTVIIYLLAKDHSAARTTRMLWSAQLRRLFRLSCLPFDPSLVGFKDGGYDAVGGRLVLVMEDARLPDARSWLSGNDGKPCAAQWRGNDLGNRSELWGHLAGLFRALSSIHESGIVHRRIWPVNLLIDEGASRDQAGFLKLGRFEASTFFHQARRPASSLPEEDAFTAWYSVELGPSSDQQVVRGTPAGDVYSLMVSALWLLTGRPDNKELFRFIQALAQGQPDQADRIRREVLTDAVGKLLTRQEQEFFSALHRHRFSATTTAAHSHRQAEAVVHALRTANDTQAGSLCLTISDPARKQLDVLWTDPARTWRDWLTENGSRGRFIVGEQNPATREHRATIVFPNGLVLLCSVFKSGQGPLDWQRLVVAGASDWTRSTTEASLQLSHNTFQLLDYRQPPPSNARSWRSIFERAGPSDQAGSLVHQVQQSLDQLNFAELAFWEQNVVPVVVRKVEVKGQGADREEIVHIDQLLDDPEHYPINPPIRQNQPPDLSTILQDKTPLIWVELSRTRDLWDRDKEGNRRIEPEYSVVEVPERGSSVVRSLRLHRKLGPDAPPTIEETKAYFKTEDQGWQMGVFYRRRGAIESLPRHAVLSDILRNPVARQRRVEPAPLQLPYPSWSREKDRLVGNTLATAPLFLVQGPPGTGKSTYITGLMRYILSEEEDPGSRLLVVAHMQHAVDDIYERAMARLDLDSSPKGWDQPLLLRLRPTGRDRDAERMGKEMAEKAGQLFSECLEALDGRDDPVSRAAAASLELELQASQPSRELQDRMIEAASIIFTTCTDRHLQDIIRTEFDWVIIEEAGRLVGCDLVIPMRLGYRWVLIGDPEQIGPYRKEDFEAVVKRQLEQAVKDKEITEIERESLDSECRRLLGPFEMLFNGVPLGQREKLTQQHRMHPQICEVVSNVFYGGEIKDEPETAGKLICLYDHEPTFLANKAVLWLDVPHLKWPDGRSTEEERERGGYSYRNKHEAEVLQFFLDTLNRYTPANLPEKNKYTLAAISPYRYQIQTLRNLFRLWSCPDWLEVERPGAFTSTSYQGREADIVLLSMVRNNTNYDMGFLDRQQMNVALSRAKRLLVVVGCFEMLRHRAQSSEGMDSFVPLLVRYLEPHVRAARDIFQEFQR